MAATDVVSSLQREVEIVKEGLKNVDENIKKLTGRDPSESRGPVGNRRITLKRNFGERITGPAQKRLNSGNSFSRLGPRLSLSNKEQRYGQLESDGEEEDDDDQKPTLQSTVVAAPVPSRLKPEAVSDKKTQTRNKRMFGVLLGTLQKFKESSSKEAAREKRRHEIEKKHEEAAQKEREEALRQRKELFFTRKEKQTKLENLERQMEVAEMLEEWEEHDRKVNNFIKTKARPHIFYHPAKHNETTLSLLENTIKNSEESIKKRRQEVEEFLKKPEKEDKEEKTGKNIEQQEDVEIGSNHELEGDNRGDEGDARVESGKMEVGNEELESESKDGVKEGIEHDKQVMSESKAVMKEGIGHDEQVESESKAVVKEEYGEESVEHNGKLGVDEEESKEQDNKIQPEKDSVQNEEKFEDADGKNYETKIEKPHIEENIKPVDQEHGTAEHTKENTEMVDGPPTDG